ncbi:hypothetical protein EJB05_57212 [Eragrostis curvula]|uniref:G-patch domain-containing protein n=1 Tax=Eragrostis curvula TaxID=38414 RepID=A0A5J9SEM3_9POAL|nr:hypothetical protein EJB05_57212 [Eragrostis curvula]
MAAIGSSNIGFQLLKKSGWKEGTGLGAQEQGRLEPVETRVKNNKRGLGSKEPKAKPKPKVEDDDVEKDPKKPKQDMPTKRKTKLAAKRIRKIQEEEKRLQEKEFEMAFFREFWPDNV